jgi:hypothetical protein
MQTTQARGPPRSPTARCCCRQLFSCLPLAVRVRPLCLHPSPCRYSPNLSRRCTHLAVPRSALKAGAACSHKLRSALRHEGQWGLHIVDLAWVEECDRAGRQLEEAPFRPPAELLAALATPAPQEQAPPNASAAERQAGTGSGSVLAADTYHHHSLQCARQHHARYSAATGGAATGQPPDIARRSVNSPPLSSFGGGNPAASLQTQPPSIKHSLQRTAEWAASSREAGAAQEPGVSTACTQRVTSQIAAPPAQVGQLPDALGGGAPAEIEGSSEPDFGRLHMTQAGFMPAADLLAQLRASAIAALPGRAAAASTGALGPPKPPGQQCSGQPSGEQVHVAAGTAGPAAQPRGHGNQQAALMERQLVERHRQVEGTLGLDVSGDVSAGAVATTAKEPSKPDGRLSSADLLQQLRLSAAGLGLCPATGGHSQQRWQQASHGGPPLPRVIQHAPAEGSEGAAQQGSTAAQQGPGLATADLLDWLRASRAGASSACGQGASREAQQPGDARAPLEELLRQLHACGPAAASAPGQRQQRRGGGQESPAVDHTTQLQKGPAADDSLQQGTPLTGGELRPASKQQATPSSAAGWPVTQSSSLPGQPGHCSDALQHREQAGRSADELVRLLRQQQLLQPDQQDDCARPSVAEQVPAQPTGAAAMPRTPLPDNGASATHLAAQLRQLAQQSSFSPLPQQSSTCAVPEQQGQAAAQHSRTFEREAMARGWAAQADAAPVSGSSVLASQPTAASAHAPASAAEGAAGSPGSTLQPTAVVGGGADVAPAVSPASSAGSPAVHAASTQAQPASKCSVGETPEPASAVSQASRALD